MHREWSELGSLRTLFALLVSATLKRAARITEWPSADFNTNEEVIFAASDGACLRLRHGHDAISVPAAFDYVDPSADSSPPPLS
jgi:hypothetical protein